MSIARKILNEQLNSLVQYMKGDILDIGGEREQVADSFTRPNHDGVEWTFLNLNPKHNPDILSSADNIPVSDNSYDAVLLIEILEHVDDPVAVLSEIKRVLRPDGLLFLSMPFSYRHHMNPRDYIRWSHEKLFLEIEAKLGMPIEVFIPRGGWLTVVMNDLSLGLASFSKKTFIGSTLIHYLGRLIAFLIRRTYKIWRKIDIFLSDEKNTKSFFHRFTTGYLLVARKPSSGEAIEARECPDVLKEPFNLLEKSSREMSLWSTQKQISPPDFGKALLVPKWWLDISVGKRRTRASSIISNTDSICDVESGLVSIVILSCKRLPQLKRLVSGLRDYLADVESYEKVEIILVDNGSGERLIQWAAKSEFFDQIIANKVNLGMAVALSDAYSRVKGEYILLLEEDFIVDYDRPFMQRCISLFDEYPEIGIIRLKNQRNWGKMHRIISPLRSTLDGTDFWTWLPSFNGKLNVWAAGSVLFRKVSFIENGGIPIGPNVERNNPRHQGALYEEIYGKTYNKKWLAAKVKDCYPFIQPNDNVQSPGWGEVTDDQLN